MQSFFRILTILLLPWIVTVTTAQTNYEIRATNLAVGEIAIQLRATSNPCPATADYVTDIVFGLKWPNTINFDLPASFASEYNMKKAGVRGLKGGYFYQAFYSDPIGFNPAAGWQLDQWIDIVRISNLAGSGVATFEICEPNFDVTTDPNVAINFVDHTPFINGSAVGVVLPVVFVQFDASYQKEHVLVHWKSSTEKNAEAFQLQRSASGIQFQTIYTISASNNPGVATAYEYKDVDAVTDFKGKSVFYRVLQKDQNGHVQYTDVRRVLIPSGKNQLKLAYNEVANSALLLYDSEQNDRVFIRLLDAGGKQVYMQEADVKMGGNQFTIPMANLANGIYTVELAGRFDRQNVSMLKR